MGLPKRAEPPARAEFTDWQARMRTAFFEAVSETDMREIVETLVAKAKTGDLGAVRILLSYGIGSPAVKVRNAVIVQGDGLAPLPTAPARVLPGTTEKFDVMARRATNGQPLHDARDKTRDLG
jgi:hypothetical protein